MMIPLLALLAAAPEPGPAIGQPLSAFELRDQEGRLRSGVLSRTGEACKPGPGPETQAENE